MLENENAFLKRAAELRQRLRNDPHRPQYHFLAPGNWMNDPNGVIQWNGQFHLFYQHNPYEPAWGSIHWGHAVSDDLVHWRDLPLALAPTPDSPDADGCWSGCALNADGTPVLIYTAMREQKPSICLAYGSENLERWYKDAQNPVIANPPSELGPLVGFRDPYVWRDGTTWYQLIGAGLPGRGGTALLYRSDDLYQWQYLNPLLIENEDSALCNEMMWECPQLFPLEGQHILMISVWANGQTRHTAYWIGDYREHRFYPDRIEKLDFGNHYFYAPQTLLDTHNRRIMWGWVQEGRGQQSQREAGWSGVMSLPRVLNIDAHQRLQVTPAPELQALRKGQQHIHRSSFSSESGELFEHVAGNQLEIEAQFDLVQAEEAGIIICASPDRQEETRINVDVAANQLVVHREQSSIAPDATLDRTNQIAPLILTRGEPLRLHIFIDHSVIEIYVNGQICLTTRVYPHRSDSHHVGFFARGTVNMEVTVWKLQSIWE